MAIFTGAGVALVTPMKDNGEINYEVLDKLIEDQIAGHTDAIIICGTTGEAPTLEDDEHLEAIRFTVEKTAGRIPVIAGTGSNNTAHAVMMSKEAQKLGADACLLVAPYYNKATQNGLVKHFAGIVVIENSLTNDITTKLRAFLNILKRLLTQRLHLALFWSFKRHLRSSWLSDRII